MEYSRYSESNSSRASYSMADEINKLKSGWNKMDILTKEKELHKTMMKLKIEMNDSTTTYLKNGKAGSTPNTQALSEHQNSVVSLKAELGWEYLK